MSNSSIWWVEINIVNNRTTRLRTDKIVEVRDDFMSEGKGKEKVPVVRIILEGGNSVVAEGETMASLWQRMQDAMQRKFYICEAPARAATESGADDVQ
jgi:hypothetical protein